MTLLYFFTPHQGTTKQGTHTAPSCVHSLVLKVSTNWITSVFSTHHRELIDTESKPWGRLCKMCNTFFRVPSQSVSHWVPFHPAILLLYTLHMQQTRGLTWIGILIAFSLGFTVSFVRRKNRVQIVYSDNSCGQKALIREERWLYIWCSTP